MKVDPPENRQVHHLKLLLLVASVVSLVLLLLSAFEENIKGQWREHQADYQQALLDRADTDQARSAALNMTIGFKQVYLPQLNRIDRCVTCHVGIDDPDQADAPQPIRTHSGDIFKHHPVDKFGCTVCHDGQGRAVTKEEAHGEGKDWPTPLLAGDSVYIRCGQCHYEGDLFGAEDDLFTHNGQRLPLDQEELAASVAGAEQMAQGKKKVMASGCLGCHRYRGRGGSLGPDITFVGDKIAHDFDFKHVQGEHTVEQWLVEHFKTPQTVSPGSLMPQLDLSDKEAQTLARYMMSLQSKALPAAYTPIPPRRDGKPATGKQLYNMFCLACHGPQGKGSTVRMDNTFLAIDAPAQLMVPSLNHPDTLATASDDYLRFVIRHGRKGSSMVAWQADAAVGVNGGLQASEVERLVQYIRSWEAPKQDLSLISAARGVAKIGRSVYTLNCAGCHGLHGQGGIGPSLNSTSFLAIASDTYLARTIVEGRPNTAMTGYRHFSTQQISDLIAYLRSWNPVRSDQATALKLAQQPDTAEVSFKIGKILFNSKCADCHGKKGQGDLGPSIGTQAFLTLADNAYLFNAITKGRPGTAMPAWGHLSDPDVASLVKYLRSWQTKKTKVLPTDRLAGDAAAGQLVYQGSCLSCHGDAGQGAIGPAIGNSVFLEYATDSMLKEWISYGKTSTAMLGFLRGQQGLVELSETQINNVVAYIRTLPARQNLAVANSPNGRPELGETWYKNSCASCHGTQGQGGSAPSLSNPAFLRAASDGFLTATLALGRDGTEMRPVKKGPESILALSSDQINDVVAYLRSWQTDPPLKAGEIPHHFVIPWDLARGKRLYQSHCSGCHGINGKAEVNEPGLSAWAPTLNNEEFLQAATDGFLQATIVRGRMGTSMRPFGRGAQGIVDLSMQEIDDIVAYIRQWSKKAPSPMTRPARRSLVEVNQTTPSPRTPTSNLGE